MHKDVNSVFYDSKDNICVMDFHLGFKRGSYEAEIIEKCARKSLTQYPFFDYTGGYQYWSKMTWRFLRTFIFNIGR
jgi:hypothetical protein